MTVDKDGVMRISRLTAEAVELGRHILDLSLTVAGQVSDFIISIELLVLLLLLSFSLDRPVLESCTVIYCDIR